MRVLWFSNTPAAGIEAMHGASSIKGTGGWLYALNKAIEKKVELHVAFQHPYRLARFRHGNTSFYPVYTGNILFQRLRERLGFHRPRRFLAESYLRVVKNVQPDVIHIHGTESPFLMILGATDIPIVISIQGNLTVWSHKFRAGFHGRHLHLPAPHSGSYLRSLVLGRQTYRRGLDKLSQTAEVERASLRKAQHIIGRTDWDRRVTRMLAPKSNYFVGQELLREKFYNAEWSQTCVPGEGRNIIFTTTGNRYYKGFETLCQSLSVLRGAGVNVEWRVAGVSENSLINQITRKELGADYPQQELTLLGAMDEHELIEQMLGANIYVMPSHIENSPNSLCEAMLLGMPCVATFAGGTGSMLKDDEEGILVQDGDPWVMAGAIQELLGDPARAARYGAAARKTARIRHNSDTIVYGLLQVYRQVVAKYA